MTQRPQHVVVADLAPLTEMANEHGISTHMLISIIGNVVVFVPLGLAVARSLALGRDASAGTVLLGGTVAGALVSASIELLQSVSTSRFTDWRDLALNTLGALLGAVVAALLIRSGRRPQRSRPQTWVGQEDGG